jgi:nicotinate phosphoribosyltransferase
LVDYNNDSVRDSLLTVERMFRRYRQRLEARDEVDAKRYVLYGVRLDTSNALRDVNVPPLGDPDLDLGVTPRLVFAVRQALDHTWESWDLPDEWRARADAYCRSVRIVVSGGFTAERIRGFEQLHVPADMYAVGSALFANAGPSVTDFTADVVRVEVGGEWIPLAKVGRQAGENPDLERVT